MIRTRRHQRSGFSVVDLMTFLTIGAVFAVIAMYGVARWVRHTKAAEAIGNVETIAKAAAAYYDESDLNQPPGSKSEALRASRHFPPSSRGTVPAELSDVQGKRYKSASADWLGSPWREIRFSINQPQFYAYSFEADGAGAAARAAAVARGDLDADGVWAIYHLTVQPDDSGNARVSTPIEIQNPEE